MNLNHKTLQVLLAKIFFGDAYEENMKYVIPKQGNWLNPQEMEQVSTYIAYQLRENEPLLAPITRQALVEDLPTVQDVVAMVADVDLQFVGINAEDYAQSVTHWDTRSDVHKIFDAVEGQLMLTKRRVVSVPYWQDGANTIFSFNVSFKLLWQSIQSQTVPVLSFVQMDGDVVVKT